jgi:hypothetical protein
MQALGKTIMVVGIICGLISELIGFYFCYMFFGFLGLCAGIVIFPVVFIAMPFYLLFAEGLWIPFALGMLSTGLYVVGQIIVEK